MSEEMPKSVTNAVKTSVEKHLDDIESAVSDARKRVRGLPDYETVATALIDSAIRDAVYTERCRRNVRLRNAAGGGRSESVDVGKSKFLNEMYESHYQYSIAGKSLGQVFGKELDSIIESESNIASGHLFNVRLGKRLKKLVRPDQQVKDALSERKLKQIFKECSERTKATA